MWLQAFLPTATHVGFNFEEIIKGITVQSARNIGLQIVMVCDGFTTEVSSDFKQSNVYNDRPWWLYP